KGVGVDVVSSTLGGGGERGQHRNEIAADDLSEHGRVDLFGLADESKVDDFLDIGAGIEHGAAHLARQHHVAVLAGQSHRLAAGRVDEADDWAFDRSRQHHFDDLDRRRVGDAQPGGEFRLDAEPLEHLADLWAAAVHDHRIDGGLFHQHDV